MKHIKNKYLRIAVIIFAAVIACGILTFIIAESLVIRGSKGSAKPGADYLIVLGAKVEDYGPSFALRDRLYAALDYLQENPDCTAIVSGGKGSDEPMAEGECMARWLEEKGLDPARIIIEDKATDTRENLRFSTDLIGSRWKEKRIAVVSSEYHLCRANYLGRKLLDYDFEMLPAATTLRHYKYYYFYREALGMVYTRLFYIK